MLRIHPRPGHVCPWPGQGHSGQIRRYIGRDTKVVRNEAGEVEQIGHPAQREPVELDPKSKPGQRVIRLMLVEQDKPFWPADEATAAQLQVPFVPVELVDGEFQPKAAPAQKAASTASGRGPKSDKGDE
jgi:hypothetical protein